MYEASARLYDRDATLLVREDESGQLVYMVRDPNTMIVKSKEFWLTAANAVRPQFCRYESSTSAPGLVQMSLGEDLLFSGRSPTAPIAKASLHTGHLQVPSGIQVAGHAHILAMTHHSGCMRHG